MAGSAENVQAKSDRGSAWLLYGIIGGMVVGVLLGGFAPGVGAHVKILGELFLNALMMIVVPLVMLSMITGVTGLGDIRRLGSLGKRTILFYAATTGLSVTLGLVLVNIIQPGAGISHGETLPGAEYRISGGTVTLDEPLVRTTYDNRYIVALTDQGLTAPVESVGPTQITTGPWLDSNDEESKPKATGRGVELRLPIADKVKGKPRTIGAVLEDVIRGLIPRNLFSAMAETKVLPLIIFSLIFGAILTTLGPSAKPAIELFNILNHAVMEIVHLIMKVAPVGIMGLIAGRLADAGGFAGFMPELIGLAKYFLTVVSGLAIHGFVTLPLILWLVGKRVPLRYGRGMAPALLNAFSTASSSATIPLTMEGVEERNGISNRTASFVIPLGATINMDGTALYEAVAALFIAQVYGIELGFGAMVIVFLTATLASIGAAGIPEAGLVTMLIVLNAVGLPVEGIALLLAIDWLLDRFRTTVNVWGDAVGCGVIETLENNSAQAA